MNNLKRYKYKIVKPHPLLGIEESSFDPDKVTFIEYGGETIEMELLYGLKEDWSTSDDGTTSYWYSLGHTHQIPVRIVESNPEYFQKLSDEDLQAIRNKALKERRRKQYEELKREFE